MGKSRATLLGEEMLKNTQQIIDNLPNGEEMQIGDEILTKEEIQERFRTDGDFAVFLGTYLDKYFKEFAVRKSLVKDGGSRNARVDSRSTVFRCSYNAFSRVLPGTTRSYERVGRALL